MQSETALTPGLRRPRPGERFELPQSPYLTENWRMLLGLFDEDDPSKAKIRDVRIFNRIASIWQKDIVIRTPMPAPDGFYSISEDRKLVFLRDCDKDIELFTSSTMIESEILPREDIHRLLSWVTACHGDRPEGDRGLIVLKEPGFLCEYDVHRCFQIRSPSNPRTWLSLPIRGEPIFVNAFHLRLALTECTRYDSVVIAHDPDPERLAPLFIGVSRSQCAVIETKPAYIKHKGRNGQLLR
jgi:hypothetical protein